MFASFWWFCDILGQCFECSRIFEQPIDKVVEAIDIVFDAHPDSPEAYAYFGRRWKNG